MMYFSSLTSTQEKVKVILYLELDGVFILISIIFKFLGSEEGYLRKSVGGQVFFFYQCGGLNIGPSIIKYLSGSILLHHL